MHILWDACLMSWQKSPMVKGKIELAFAWLDRLCPAKVSEDVVDAQESMRQAGLFM